MTPLTIDGETISALPGESIAAALIASGWRKFRNDGRGAPRGLFCGMGACFECRVSVNNGPPQRACLTKVVPGMDIRTLDYKERLPDPQTVPDTKVAAAIDCDVMIVGAGPAGMSAAIRLAEAGKQVVVVDERQVAGGQYFKQKISAIKTDGGDDRQYRDGAAMIDRLQESGANLINGATVWGAFKDESGGLEILATGESDSYRIKTRQLIVATGAYESVPPFPGWTLPGVMTTGAAQTLVRAYRVGPAQKVLIAGNGPLNLQLACELIQGGVDVVAVAESAPAPMPRRMLAAAGVFLGSPKLCLRGMDYLRTLRRHKVPLFYGHHICRADGENVVDRGSVAQLDRSGCLVAGTEKEFATETICLGYRLQPSAEILRVLGCKQRLQSPGVPVPERDGSGQTTVPGVFAIGDGAVLGGAQVAMLEGRIVADAILKNAPVSRDYGQLRRQRRFQRALWAMYEAPDAAGAEADTIVCRCESVDRRTIEKLIQSGVHDLGNLKRLSRAGMGLCQGRYCQRSVACLLAGLSGNEPGPTDLFASRAPVKPVTIAHAACEKPEWQGFRVIELPDSHDNGLATPETIGETDVLIIGAGVIGTSTALFLAREGVEVMLVDRGVSNGQASGGNAGSLHLQLLSFDFPGDDSNLELPAAATLPLQKLGIATWMELEKELQADFELNVTGGIMLAGNDDDLKFLQKKGRLDKHFGIEVDLLSASDVKNLLPAVADHIVGGAFCAREGKVNPLLATRRLLAAALADGAVLRERTSVSGIEYSRGKYQVSTDRGIITCNRLINAAGGWSGRIAEMLGRKLPIRFAPQQMHVTQAAAPLVPYLVALARRHLSIKQTANGNILIGGGWSAGFDPGMGLAVASKDSIEGNLWVAQRVIPLLGGLQMIRSWAAMGVMIDGAPIIGELPGQPGFYNVAGANGYTMGPILGRITAELVRTGRSQVNIAPFSVERFV